MQFFDRSLLWPVIIVTAALIMMAVGLLIAVAMNRRKFLTAQRKQFEQLRASEQKYRNLFENSLIGMVRLSLHDWTLLELNEAFKKIASHIPLDTGDNFIACLAPPEQSRLKAGLYNNGAVENFETHVRCRDGSIRWITFSGKVYFTEGYVEAVVADSTEQVKAQERLREHAALLKEAYDAIIVVSLDETVQFWNPGAERMFQWSAAEAAGRPVTDLIYSEMEIAAFRKRREELLQSGEWNGEIIQVRKDGREVVSASRWTLVRDIDEKVKSILEIHTDITEKKQLEARFQRIQRLESLGILAGGIAHDLNNVLAPIVLSIQVLKQRWDNGADRDAVATLEASAKRGAELVKQVLAFARGIEGQRIALRAESVVQQALHTAAQTFPRSISLESAIAEDLWPAVGDASQLEQVLMNLFVNARDAMPRGGRLSVTTENVVIDEQFVKDNPEAKTGVYVLIQVTDTGEGIPAGDLDKIFEPFYTTKSLGKGTGLGLSTALGIVKSHEGFMIVDSKIGTGTTFRVYLPAQIHEVEEKVSGQA